MNNKIYFKILALVVLFAIIYGCVDSITTPTTSTNLPKVVITYPVTGDTVKAGRTKILYSAVDKTNGDGIDYLQLYTSVTDSNEIFYIVDNEFPEIYLLADSSYIGQKIGYKLSAFNLDGESGSSGDITNIHVSKNTTPPDAPSNLQLIAKSNNAVNLLWNDNSIRETNYQVYRKDGTNGEYRAIKLLPANTISWDDTDLSEFIVYYYKVLALNQYGNSPFSNEVTTQGNATGSAPTNLQAQALGATYVLLSWTSSSQNILGFKVQRKLDAESAWAQIAVIPSDLNEYMDNGLIASTKYNYRVASYTGESQSAWSGTAIVTTQEKDYFPPANVKATYSTSLKKVVISWDNNNPTGEINNTFVERRLDGATEYTPIGAVSGNLNTFVDSSLNYDKVYYYRARFLNIYDYYTPYSNSDSAYVPIIPPDLTITEFQFGKQYFLEWNYNITDEVGYELHRKQNSGSFVLLQTFENNVNAFIDNVPDSNSIFYYKIRAYTQTTKLPFSEIVSTAGGTGNIIRPTDLTAAYDTLGQSVVLTWKDNSNNELAFELQRKLFDTSNWTTFTPMQAGTTTYTDSGVQRGNKYVYRVRARNSTDYSSYSNEVTVQIPF